MTLRFIAIFVCLTAATLLSAQEERRILAVQQPVRATAPAVLKAAGIDSSLIDAAQFRILSQLSDTGLRAAMDGADPATITAVDGRTLGQVIQATIGEVDEQLVYKPLTPCRLIDTRNAGGSFAAGETRIYDLIGPSSYSAYGGNAAGCGIPNTYISTPGVFMRGNRVRALVLNLTSVQPTGTGFLVAWPTNQATPNASMLNYGDDFALANGVTARTCNASCDFVATPGCNPCPLGDLSIRNASGTTQVLVDVLGYMEPAEIPSGSEAEVAGVSLADSDCKTLTSCVATNNSGFERTMIVTGYVNVTLNHTNGTTSQFMMSLGPLAASCGLPLEGAGVGRSKYRIPSVAPSYMFMEGTTSSSRSSQIGPYSSKTYYLNGQNAFGAGPGDNVDAGWIRCSID